MTNGPCSIECLAQAICFELILGGDPPKSVEFHVPYLTLFIAFSYIDFRNWSLCLEFFQKFLITSKISPGIFSTSSKSKKCTIRI